MTQEPNVTKARLDEVDVRGEMRTESVSTEELGNGPIVFSSQYSTIQAAVDGAGGGHLLIDDTKTEDLIELQTENAGLTMEWVGDNWIEQPSNWSDGDPIIYLEEGGFEIADLTFIRPRIRNPNLSDGDIDNKDTRASNDTADAISNHRPNDTGTNSKFDGLTIRGGNINHLQGWGVRMENTASESELRVIDLHVDNVAYDGMDVTAGGDKIVYRGCTVESPGRHGYTISGSDNETSVFIVNCFAKDTYTGGIDIEDGQRVSLDARVENTGTGGGGSAAAGLNISSNSTAVGGRIVVHNPNENGVDISCDRLEDLSATVHGGNIFIGTGTSTSGSATLTSYNSPTRGVDINRPSALDLDIFVEKSNYAGVEIAGGQGCDIDAVLRDVVQDSNNAPDGHGFVTDTIGGTATKNNQISVEITDTDGNVTDAIRETGGSDDWNRYSGNVHNGYNNVATSGLGSNSDATDIIG